MTEPNPDVSTYISVEIRRTVDGVQPIPRWCSSELAPRAAPRSEAESAHGRFCCCCCCCCCCSCRRRDLPWWQRQLMQEEAVSPELSRESVVEWHEGNEDTSLRRGRIVHTHRRSKAVINTTEWSVFIYSLTEIVSELKMWPSGRRFE